MKAFPLCTTCDAEYRLSRDRRFHAQTNTCPDCGPRVWAVDASRRACGSDDEAIRYAVVVLKAGKILALRGVGGYQLLVDAANFQAVQLLRDRKRRLSKPLAVMIGSVQEACRLCHVDGIERSALTSPANPIVLLKTHDSGILAANIHPGLGDVGLMLPSTPLHAMLIEDFGGPFVCTSGNREGDPLVYDVDHAERELAGVCDAWLHHDRPVERPIDDSVARVIAGRPVTFRLARGMASLPLAVDRQTAMLAVGGDMKCATAWCNGEQAVLGPHVGDQHTLSARARLTRQLDAWQELYRFQPTRIVHDLHPDYFTTHLAEGSGLPTSAVQHHHAHVVAGMIEHAWLDRAVLGVVWDGTGYGPDGTIWGGEFLLATRRGYERFASLRRFRLPGGELAIRQPWRSAFSVLIDALGVERATRALPSAVHTNAHVVLKAAGAPRLSPLTTSAGRLFDAAASIILGVECVDYLGQAAMMLESVADAKAAGGYPLTLREGTLLELDWRPMFRELLRDRETGVCPSVMAARFHRGLAKGILEVCLRRPDLPVVLAGGVFQNRLLTEMIVEAAGSSRRLGLPGVIPPGDGGLAAGQLAVALSLEDQR